MSSTKNRLFIEMYHFFIFTSVPLLFDGFPGIGFPGEKKPGNHPKHTKIHRPHESYFNDITLDGNFWMNMADEFGDYNDTGEFYNWVGRQSYDQDEQEPPN